MYSYRSCIAMCCYVLRLQLRICIAMYFYVLLCVGNSSANFSDGPTIFLESGPPIFRMAQPFFWNLVRQFFSSKIGGQHREIRKGAKQETISTPEHSQEINQFLRP